MYLENMVVFLGNGKNPHKTINSWEKQALVNWNWKIRLPVKKSDINQQKKQNYTRNSESGKLFSFYEKGVMYIEEVIAM